ncbi:MAG: DUF4337 domain-containing protein [Verrucomicrobia bacterium]|nr:DUF4337 domain-containing protein [Verrucomicrobiota bacterium]NBU08692.1 DUF4337 domain-containing protein [Pseudomonadota bacterium]NDA68257.1 DUF4337 domain-containing protein [Verrucomicrobiota bacterium]NDB76544.1 DUF4337 domain-containing protein [Verrucomicrobiota bacterium]NDD39591.1 DUF4337 domain-containing protein [Verrucomicrobiota bacterium]
MHPPTTETPVPETGKERLNSLIAITVAVLAALMGITKVKDDNIVQAMQQAKINAVDTWGEYQAKKLKHHLAEHSLTQLDALQLIAPTNSVSQFAALRQGYEAKIVRYEIEERELMAKARGFEAEYDKLNYRDDQFDLSDAALSVALCVLATASLANRRWLLVLAWVFGAIGIIMAIAGFLRLNLHPDWLVNILS